ncbi:F-type conjugal transfer protein TraH [Escherichia coli]|nr:F-type conjugal transfer protein TraH [Escherichia coli]
MNNPLEAVTQAVNSLVTALKLPDESAKANEVLGEMSFPQFSRLLPYRDYNQESGLFMNDTTMGFMLEAIPINGANESIVEALDHMLRTKLPRGIPLCIHLMSSQLVGDRIEYGLREFSWSGEQAERFNAITRAYYMKAAATQFPLPEGMNLPLTLRHYARTQVKNVQLISMTLPDINAGCGGIDAYLGSFSFINGEQLQRFVKQIMSNAAGYFFDLALQTTVPEIKTAKDFLQKMASDINSMNLSSCQAAQGIIGGLFPRTQVSQQKVCQDIAGESNIFADWAASRQGCTVGGKSDSVRDKASDKDKERVTKNINIMWNALSKNRMFDGNKELKEFVMTLTGSLVFGPNGEITPLSARTTDRSIIRAMMEGGTAKIYHCNDSDKCLKVVADTPVTISRDNALKSQITKLLASIQNKAVSDTPLDDKEKGFISSTTIPVFKYLVDPQMLGVSNSMIYQLTDYIGYDILLQYIQELIQQARAMVATGNYDEAVIEHINDNMNDATRQIAAFQSQVQVQQDALLVVDRQMSYMRQQLSARMLSRYQNNYHFGGSTL